jgi:DNA-damage-inducible protein D
MRRDDKALDNLARPSKRLPRGDKVKLQRNDSGARLQALVAFVEGGRMSNEVDVFHFDDSRTSFEAFAQGNGFTFWLASKLLDCLGYATMAPIRKAVNNAMAACASLDIPIPDNFQETGHPAHGRDWKLSRFACYLTVMNGDSRNPRVAAAQAYFITMAEAFRQHVQEAENVERVLVRGEVSEREKALSGTAHKQGVQNYAFFQNAGYRGMYNLDLSQIRARKGIPSGRSPLDFMGKTELAANLFRITQTDEKIQNDDARGQLQLERAASEVGRKVRRTMIELSGTPPEKLPSARDLKDVQKGLKRSQKEYRKLDKPRKSDSS